MGSKEPRLLWRPFEDIERLKEIDRAPSLFCEDGLQVREFMSRSRRFLNIPDGKSSGKRIGVMAIDLLEGHLLAAIAINAELPTIIDEIDEKLYRNLVHISVSQLYILCL